VTPFEEWAIKTADALMGDVRETQDFDALRHRLTIGLVQARAQECRQISTSLLVKGVRSIADMANGLSDRSSKLESLGMRMATVWPPPDDGWPEGIHLVKTDESQG